ncbi:ABC transporter substrate-binding protein [Leptolyngbya sp. Heron Island J]|uniref:ABC transporter substrate-binding protein n=1 Tax=Leptolyngbya sp. Heron Island J TaxID=1385935 RepID=UPI001376995F|nr:iron-siderophore ABC transporter substrate-binding protein [Leptolyngbya sp. Heron Island J]MDV3352432.1 iron-siderophore ABC transporter substrate-binding protein [Leptothoe sp. LEGE 181152]
MGSTALIASACTRATQPDQQATTNKAIKRIKHAFGETEVPTNPTRVIVLGYIAVEAVVDHGLQPIGVPDGLVDSFSHLSLNKEITADVGSPVQPSFEKIISLKPDLILTSKYRLGNGYSQLARIAPTVVFDIDSNHQWKELTRLCGEALSRQAETQKLVSSYKAKLETVKAKMSQTGKRPQVSVITLIPGLIRASGTETFAGSVLADAGISRPPSQAQPQGPQNISLEALDLVDGDVIFIPTLKGNVGFATGMRAEIDRMKAHPLWSQLKAVKNNQVYEVSSHWMNGSYISANRILDDLLTYIGS